MNGNASAVRFCWCLLLAAAMLVGSAGMASAGPLTLGTAKHLNAPGEGGVAQDISGSRVVWSFSDGDEEVVVGDALSAAPPLRLTTNGSADWWPRVSGNYVVWQGSDGDFEIFGRDLREGSNRQISVNSYADFGPAIDGGRVVWTAEGPTGSDGEIIYYDFAAPWEYPLTSTAAYETDPDIDGDEVVWTLDEQNTAITSWSAKTSLFTDLARSTGALMSPRVSGSSYAWWGTAFGLRVYVKAPGAPLKVFTFPGSTAVNPLEHNGSLVAWWTSRFDGVMRFDLWVYDTSKGLAPVRLAQNVTNTAEMIGLRDPYLVFDRDNELYAWDKSTRTISRLTNNSVSDINVVADGSRIAWNRMSGPTYEVYAATLVKSTPTLALAAPAVCNYAGPATVSAPSSGERVRLRDAGSPSST